MNLLAFWILGLRLVLANAPEKSFLNSHSSEIQNAEFLNLGVTPEPIGTEATLDDSDLPIQKRSLQHRSKTRPTPDQSIGYPPAQWRFITYKGRGSPPYGPREWRTDSRGKGVNLFIIDSGFNVHLDELDPVKVHYPPNALFPRTDGKGTIMEATIMDREGHGTKMASGAAGKKLGISPEANLYLVKYKAEYQDLQGNIWGKTNSHAFENVFDWIIQEMDELSKKGLYKNVVSFSLGFDRVDSTKHILDRLFQSFIDRLDGYESLLICGAGNDGWNDKWLADAYPKALAKPDNNVVIVGGVNMDGTLWQPTTPAKYSGLDVDIWAPVTGVDIMFSDGHIQMNADSGGTSIGTSFVAGTAAWFLSLDECELLELGIDPNDLYDSHGRPKVMKFKKFLIEKSSYQRSARVVGPGDPHPQYPLPAKLNAIYTLWQGPPPGKEEYFL
ncbi:hypothetical protein N7492_009399 [Penicillium capsulatum]|uniref:Peptidase S8/S53 domain-containing protein n=1 Tax=Penicillium capsulatum TaxID=69766 RepID=A0A9W9LGU0_9EURO|nr:hypothetical protein N7492_009399 [Penicillium capsulatum]